MIMMSNPPPYSAHLRLARLQEVLNNREAELQLSRLSALIRGYESHYRLFGASHQEKTMCSQKDEDAASPAAETLAYRRPDERIEITPKRPKFRPFIPSSRGELRAAERTPWTLEKDDGMEIVKLRAQALADAIEHQYVRRDTSDPRRLYEYELARTALEDCVMRATRMITS